MNRILDPYRHLCDTPEAGVRWACLLEATAPKAGNVFPGHSFNDLCFEQFVQAAEISATAFAGPFDRFSLPVLEAVTRVAKEVGTNVNLGILLLIGPLVQVDRAFEGLPDLAELSRAICNLIDSLDADDSRNLYAAINAAHPGGMGKVDDMDLGAAAPPTFQLAMRSARERDRIAENYSDGFTDLLHEVVPTIDQAIAEQQDLITGIAVAHLRLLATRTDSLIERKFGPKIAATVQARADFDHQNPAARAAFDNYLRTDQARPINPGTTADLIAAGLYVLLRTNVSN
ncbi:triphosphoribosyl-dephospho-CoA synthase [Rhodopirellula sp. MGV]|uniref:triphosphoribosyl-dephospho-CoA synthase n=1 Tax=Rhodopirellula sp. MGV TaxID=2023130 RepID=UPI000B961519|nr:triphosphoribosyl-dephospho-CoA synthase [Rhodopirellula sp. MGV]OYP36834.1 hypothetical protein CGZ80_07240 [Rhodopirellula sp. MGV]PNY36459.1 hypothetical protein C2E31_12740 [Rhodopirellula baltica]